MKHLLRDTIILLILGLKFDARYRSMLRKKGSIVRVLCFHDIADRAWFEEVIHMLGKECNVITPLQFHKKEFDREKINILLTFDDGYDSWITQVIPVLQKYSYTGIFFINSGLLDIAEDEEKVRVFMSERLHITPKKPLTWPGAKLLLQAGHTIGGHTKTHVDLGSEKEEEMQEEIVSDKYKLETGLGVRVTDFAFPFGTKKHISERAVDIVAQNGYDYQYSAITGVFEGEEFIIPRTLIEKNQPIASIKAWILGGYDIFKSLIP